MIRVRPSKERGYFDHGWLETYHTFSFAEYHDPAHMGFRKLRVINEDFVAAGQGFPMHSHRDMEIVTLVLEGRIEHKDSMGNRAVILPGDVQRMSAGTGVRHSEFNPSSDEPLHLLQIWILPDTPGLPPSYEQRRFDDAEKRGRLRLVAADRPTDGAVKVHQDVRLYSSVLEPAGQVEHAPAHGRHGWIQVIAGHVTLNGIKLLAGDGAAISDERKLEMRSDERSEFILFDIA